ncbi:uncharacterized protein LOC124938203 [Impatiens glandulifera]|uniref:uncharacterized protein LOC124938203 n=1 Tax=Impatiens glandulifera TaxID=253017 RepID=UPI001FB05D73|nr:uncharacterized protein LOC124938203 [Impatiens glandulifera]
MADDFVKAVDDGLRLSKRIYFGKDRSVAPPKPMSAMDKSSFSLLPPAPMVYAIISDPAIVDNPDIPSYQPHVHGRCDPPALIPLQMNGIELEANCYLDTAIVTVTGSWRVHCVMGSRCCDCRVAIPMGEEGSILGIEVDVPRNSYCTKLTAMEDGKDAEKVANAENGSFLKSHIFTFTVPLVDGGSNISLKVCWLQKLPFCDGQFSLCFPFSFPEYVTPAGKKVSKKEKIELYVDAGPEAEVLCKMTSHPLKERRRQAGKLYFVHEADVLSWSSNDFLFSYAVSSSRVYGSVFLYSPPRLDPDQRNMFSFYLLPGSDSRQKVFRKEVIFAVDISGSMRGKLLDDVKSALCASLLDLDPEDSFNIIAFNAETYLFSPKMEKANMEVIENATQWINMNFIVGDGTNISHSINQALEILSNTHNSIPMIFLVTDGAVEDERKICDYVKSQLTNRGSICPRIYTFGIGMYCNHYFLRMLATIGRGEHDAAYDADSVDVQMKAFFVRASSTILANVTIDDLDGLDDLEVHPSRIPDLLSQRPLIVSGRYKGTFPLALKARGVFPDMSDFTLDLTIHQSTDIPFEKILGKRQIDLLTAQAWFSENKELEETVAKISVQSGCQSEFTSLVLFEMVKVPETTGKKKKEKAAKSEVEKMTLLLRSLGVGFGSLTATVENRRPGIEEDRLPEAAEMLMKAACNCCGKICNRICCMCCIQACSQVNNQCAIVLTQFCGAIACLGCFSCCELCCGDD